MSADVGDISASEVDLGNTKGVFLELPRLSRVLKDARSLSLAAKAGVPFRNSATRL